MRRKDTQTAVAQGEVAPGARYVPALDGLRACAIGAVWLLHFDRGRFPGGAIGVDVFFVLSAYLITGILLGELRSGHLNLVAFYLRRVFRLMPALLAWLALFAIPTVVITHQTALMRWSVPGAALYFNDFLQGLTDQVPGPLDQSWSLAVEEQFYLVWPAMLLLACSTRRPAVLFLAVMAAGLVLKFLSPNYFLPTGHLFPLAVGATVAWARSRTPDRLSRGPGLLVAAASAAVLIAAEFATFTGPITGGIAGVVTSVAAITVITHCDLRSRSPLTRLLSLSWLTWLGARSYGVYLYGLTLLSLIPALTHWPMHVVLVPDLAATAVVIELSYRYLESPIRRAGRAWLAAHDSRSISGPTAPRSMELK